MTENGRPDLLHGLRSGRAGGSSRYLTVEDTSDCWKRRCREFDIRPCRGQPLRPSHPRLLHPSNRPPVPQNGSITRPVGNLRQSRSISFGGLLEFVRLSRAGTFGTATMSGPQYPSGSFPICSHTTPSRVECLISVARHCRMNLVPNDTRSANVGPCLAESRYRNDTCRQSQNTKAPKSSDLFIARRDVRR